MRRPEFRWWMVPAFGAGLALGQAAVARMGGMNFEGKVVLITGGSRGLGLVLAREFARRGAKVAVCARDEVELTRARMDLRQHGAEVATFVCDVTDHEQVKSTIEGTVLRF